VTGYLVDITGCDRCKKGVQMVRVRYVLIPSIVVAVLLAVTPVNQSVPVNVALLNLTRSPVSAFL
jgi:hypothetical protein